MAAAVWLAMWQNSGLLGTPGYKKYLKKKLLKHLHIFDSVAKKLFFENKSLFCVVASKIANHNEKLTK